MNLVSILRSKSVTETVPSYFKEKEPPIISYGHVITGDFSIISNSKLRDLIAESLKYREPCKADWDKKCIAFCEAVDEYALQWANITITNGAA